MSRLAQVSQSFPLEQECIRAKSFHPSGTFVEFGKADVEISVSERFEKIVRAYPNHPAIKTPLEEWSYDRLNREATRIAHALIDKAMGNPQPVTLLFEKGIQIIVAMLAVLKAGHFFVVLDPSLPKEKLATMLARSQAKLMLSDLQNSQMASEIAGDGLKVVDYEAAHCCAPSANYELRVTPEMFCYVVYTSGSTGEPKGVIWSHRNLLHHVMVLTNIYHICKDDKLGLMTSISAGALSTIALAL